MRAILDAEVEAVVQRQVRFAIYDDLVLPEGSLASGQAIHAMKVLLVVPSLSEPGGAELVALEWARYLVKAGEVVAIYTTHPEGEETAPDGVSLIQARRGSIVAQTRELWRHLKSESVDVVVALMPYCNLVSIGAARGLGVGRPKVVISEHNLARGLRTVQPGSLTKQRWLARRVYRYADLLVAVSHPVGAEAIAEYGLSWDQVTVIPNPALAKTQNSPARPIAAEGNAGHLDLVVPARFVAQKRPLLAVDVAAIVGPSTPGGVTLHFFGEGPLEEAIVSRAREADVDVVMHGWVADWFAECPAGSVVLLTSTVEGFGNVLVEAAAVGLRSVVSSRCMGAADAVLPGITGELIAGDSAEEYAAAVSEISREPVCDIEPWLRRFSIESSGEILRDALVRTTTRAGGLKR